ncbi:MAG: hypothetical protein H0T76_05720 [Nannocystis sp.]|nr:hypothetical protein [Nannocystis sp.]
MLASASVLRGALLAWPLLGVQVATSAPTPESTPATSPPAPPACACGDTCSL